MSNVYTEGYFERGEGSNYYNYGDDPGWWVTANILHDFGEAPDNGKEPKLLELGSAKGFFIHAAELWGFDSVGVDMSEWAISHTHLPVLTEGKNILLDVSSEYLPFDDGNFDVVCSWEFLEHIYTQDIPFVLDEALRVLSPQGLFVHRIAITDGQMAPDNDVTHVSMFPRHFWEGEFRQRGLMWEPAYETAFSKAFEGRDWSQRFFCWRKP